MFILKEYVRNIWFNISFVVLLILIFVSTTMIASNIEEQTKTYNLVKDYMGDEGIVISDIFFGKEQVLVSADKIFYSTTIWGESSEKNYVFPISVYDEEMEKYLSLRYIDGSMSHKADNDMLPVVISENDMGLKAGDTVKIDIFLENGSVKTVDAYITGVFADGQKVYDGSSSFSQDMDCGKLFTTYSFEQLGNPMMIVGKDNFDALDVEASEIHSNVIIKYKDDISEEDKDYNESMIWNFTNSSYIISLKDVKQRSEMNISNVLKLDIPIIVGITVLIGVCILGMVAIKVDRSMKYYAILQMCGMKNRLVQVFSVTEMIINIVISFVISASVIKIIGTGYSEDSVNVRLGNIQILTIMTISICIIIATMAMTFFLKEKSLVKSIKKVNL